MRVAIFLDQMFWRDAGSLSTDEAYALFFKGLADKFGSIEILGRESPTPGRATFDLSLPNISFCAIPYYESLYQLWRAPPAFYFAIRRLVHERAKDWDALLVHGPNPVAQLIAWQCESLGVPAIPVVRQNLVKMMGGIHTGPKRHLATMVAGSLEHGFRRLARRRPTLAVGMEMTSIYRSVGERVYNFMPCLIDDAQFQSFAALPLGADRKRLIVVGRLSPEKGHRYLFEALAVLASRGVFCQLDVVGSGPLEDELKRLAEKLDLQSQIKFHGYVGLGPALFARYAEAGMTVLPSLTEGLPQVINESLALGIPTVATAVGGIPAFLEDEKTALLVPPGDAAALAEAIERLIVDAPLYARLQVEGRRLMEGHTLEKNQEIVRRVVHDEVSGRRAGLPFCA